MSMGILLLSLIWLETGHKPDRMGLGSLIYSYLKE